MGSKREGVMLAYPVDKKKLAKLPEVVIFQRKLNGERVRLEWQDGKPKLFSSCGNEMPFFKRLKEELIDYGYYDHQFDGEMYCHGMSREDIHSICSRRVNQHPDENLLSFHIFDSLIPGLPQEERITRSQVPVSAEFLATVTSILAPKKHFLDYADQFIREGYEGVIIRHPRALYTPRKCNYMLKFKPTEKDVYHIVGWEEEEDIYGYPKGRLGSVMVRDDDGHIFSVGTGKALDAAGRDYWWRPENLKRLMKCRAHVKHSAIMTVNGYPTCTSLLEIEIEEVAK